MIAPSASTILTSRAGSQFKSRCAGTSSIGYYLGIMDNFTLAVIVGDVVMMLAFIALIVLDKKETRPTIEPVKPAGKRPA